VAYAANLRAAMGTPALHALSRIAYEQPLAEAPRGGDPADARYFTISGKFSIALTVNK
jgi:hypothetical protein